QATLQDISIDGQVAQITPAVTDPSVFLSPGFIPPSQLEVESTQEETKSLFGFLIIVPVQSTKTVSITYTMPHAYDMTQPSLAYDIRIFKQPGTGEDPYVVAIAYPASFMPVNTHNMTNVG